MSEPQTRTGIIGRQAELRSLLTILGLDEGDDRSGAVVLLAGDAGVGKTTLVREVARRARQVGCIVLAGHCLDFGGDALPYLPLVEILETVRTELPELAHPLLQENPPLQRLVPGQRPDDAAGRPSPGASDARPELFAATWRMLERLSREAPVLLVLEDLHWADTSTRELLSYVFARAPRERVHIVATYRSDDLHRRHPLRSDTAHWARLPAVTRVHLDPLPAEDVRALVLSLEPRALDGAAVDRIVSRAEGNAFYVEELVAAAGQGRSEVSAELADLVLLRLEELDERCRILLRAMSVGGRAISHALLAKVAGPEDEGFEAAIRAAIDRNVLVLRGRDGYAFRHALLAEAVYDDLLPGERVRWHRKYAEVLQKEPDLAAAAELARHARAGLDLPTAITASRSAGDAAMLVGGPAEAVRHYENALEMLAELERTSEPTEELVDLVLLAAESAVAAGLLHRALALLQDQLARLPAGFDPERRALLLHGVASTAILDDVPLDILALTTEALGLEPVQRRGKLRAHVLTVHARAAWAQHQLADARRWADEAVELAREFGLPAVQADAGTTLARLLPYDTVDEAENVLRRHISEARTEGVAAVELRSTHNLGSVFYEAGLLEQAQSVFEQASARARELRRPWAPYGVDGRFMAALVAYTRGDWAGAERLLDTGADSVPPLAAALLRAGSLGVLAGRGDERGLNLLPGLRPWWQRDGIISITCTVAAVDLHGDAGDLDGAFAVVDDLVALLTDLWQRSDFSARIRLSALLLGQLTAALGRAPVQDRASLAGRARPLMDAAHLAAERAMRRGPESVAWLARARAEYLRLQWTLDGSLVDRSQLLAAWTDAADAFARYGHVFELARTQARLAQVLHAAGRSAQAEQLEREATATARRLGAAPLLRELGAVNGGPTRPVNGSGPVLGELTARENEVLLQLAQGRSNREISRALFISPKTVSVHVSNLLSKLHASGRTEAVVIAQRQGLLTRP